MELDANEWHRMLADEQIRNEEHRRNFLLLKSEHDRLMNEHRSLNDRLEQTLKEKRESQEKHRTVVQQLRKELIEKQNVIEEMKAQKLSPQNLSILKLNVRDEVETAYRQRFATVEEEAEQQRIDCNKLRYELAYLKTELEHAQEKHLRMQEEITLKYQAEISFLQKDKEALQRAFDEQTKNHDANKLNAIKRENQELQQRNQTLQNELEEISEQKQQITLQYDDMHRLQMKQGADHAASVHALELENSTIKNQLNRLQAELKANVAKEIDMSNQMQAFQQKNNELQSSVQELQYRSRLETANGKIEITKQKAEMERERERLLAEINSLKRDLESACKSNEMQKILMIEQEKEMQKRIIALQEEEWNKQNRLENEKFELEARIQELERMRLVNDQEARSFMKLAEEKSAVFLQQKENLEKEIASLKARKSSNVELESSKAEFLKLENALRTLQKEKRNLQAAVAEMQQNLIQIQTTRATPLNISVDVEKEKIQCERTLIQKQLSWEEQKSQLTNRISNLEAQITQIHSKHYNETQNNATKLKKYRRAVVKLRNREEIQKAKLDELETENEVLKKNVPFEDHRNLQKQLRQLQRKHIEFRNVMLGSDPSATSFVSDHIPSLDKNHRQSEIYFPKEEIQHVKNRISILDDKQRRQMIELEKEDSEKSA